MLEAFASAAIEVSRRIEAWRPLIESTADEDERAALIEDAQADLARAIEETEGIDEDEYYAIYESRAGGPGAAQSNKRDLLRPPATPASPSRRVTAYRGTEGR